MITVHNRAAAITRAKDAIAYLETHPRTTKGNLGTARTQANLVHNYSGTREVFGAVHALEDLVVKIYGYIPTHKPGTKPTREMGPRPQREDIPNINAGSQDDTEDDDTEDDITDDVSTFQAGE